jgi:hypothetical protein
MNRQQVSWLIVRAFGLYLLVQAFMHVPELLGGLYAARFYSNLVSSLSSENDYIASSFRQVALMYQSSLVTSLLKVVLFSAAGIYLLRAGGFLIRLLDRVPATPTEVGGEGDAQQVVGRGGSLSQLDSSGDG